MIECMRNAACEHMTLDEQISFCEEKSKNIKLKAKPQTFIDIKNSLEKLKELRGEEKISCNCQHNSNSRVKVNSLEIIVRMIGNKPYYELKYRQVGKKDYSIGYSSYDLKIVLGYIDTYFEIVESDNHTNADRIRNMSDEELVELITGLSKHCLAGIGECDCSAYETCTNCNVEVRKWLQSEAE